MAEAIGTISAIVGLVQAGLSLAKALNTYAGAVSDANDDIVVIADDIYATYRHLNDLGWVLKQNEKRQVLTQDALINAERCVKQSEVLVQKLGKLLVKGGGSIDLSSLKPDQIDISKFRRGIWYIFKSEFELRRTELHHIKADISMVYLTFIAMSADTATERKQATDEMELVYNMKTTLSKGLEKARKRRKRDAQEASRHDTDDEEDYEYGNAVNAPAVIYETIEDVYKEFDNWLVQKRKKEQNAAEERKKIEMEAVAIHQKFQEEAQRKILAEQLKLRNTLTQHGLPPQRIDQIVRDAYPQASARPDVTSSTSSGATAIAPAPAHSTRQHRRFLWFRNAENRQSTNHVGGDPPIPNMLKDITAPGGVARLKAIYFQKVGIAPGQYEIMKLEALVPDYELIPKILSSKPPISGTDTMPSLLQGFADIPEDYRYHIAKDLQNFNATTGEEWVILQIEPVKPKGSRISISRKHVDKVVGVYVILRRVTPQVELTSMGAPIAPDGDLLPRTGAEGASEEGPAMLRSALRQSVGQSVADLQLVPKQAEEYRARANTANDESELVYAQNSRQPEYSRHHSEPSNRKARSERQVGFSGDNVKIPTPSQPRRRQRTVRYLYENDSSEASNQENYVNIPHRDTSRTRFNRSRRPGGPSPDPYYDSYPSEDDRRVPRAKTTGRSRSVSRSPSRRNIRAPLKGSTVTRYSPLRESEGVRYVEQSAYTNNRTPTPPPPPPNSVPNVVFVPIRGRHQNVTEGRISRRSDSARYSSRVREEIQIRHGDRDYEIITRYSSDSQSPANRRKRTTHGRQKQKKNHTLSISSDDGYYIDPIVGEVVTAGQTSENAVREILSHWTHADAIVPLKEVVLGREELKGPLSRRTTFDAVVETDSEHEKLVRSAMVYDDITVNGTNDNHLDLAEKDLK